VRFIGLALLLLAREVFAQSPAALSEADRAFVETHFLAAKRAEAGQEFGQAVEEYKIILAKFPTAVPRVHHNLGLALYFDRKCEAAVASLRKADQLEPGVAATHLLIGMSYMCLQDPRKALPEFQQAHKLGPTTETAVQLGMAYSVLNQSRSAVKFFRACLESGEDNETTLYLLGEEYMRLAKGVAEGLIGRYADTAYDNLVIARIFDSQQFHHVAAQAYLKAIRKDPWNAGTLLRLARLLAILGRKEASDATVERYRQVAPADRGRYAFGESIAPPTAAVKAGGNTNFEQEIRSLPAVEPGKLPLVPLFPTAINELLRKRLATPQAGKWKAVIGHLAAARYKEAISEVDGAAAPTDWLPAYVSAYAHLWAEDIDGAERMANRPAIAAETGPAVQILRWEIYEQLGRSYYQKLLDQYPGSARAPIVRARILDAEEKPEAIAEYKAAVAASPRQAGIRLALADNLMINARIPEALDLCRQELDIDPPSVDARACLGRIYVDMRQPDQALPYLQAALKSRAGDAALHSALGRLYELKNQLEPAAAEYRKALTLDPGQNKLHYLLANVYRRLGRNALADRESDLFQRAGMAEREQHINFVQRYYRTGSQSRPAGRGASPPP
jgi:tetratricopeptide (TPR) repeat protein